MRAHLLPLLFLVLTGCEEPRTAPVRVPKLGALNPHLLAVMSSYPTDGTHGYHWPRSGTWMGNTRTLRYGGRVLAEGDPKQRCHCSGLTFEVFLRAWERWCRAEKIPYRIREMDLEGVRALQKQWFGVTGDRATLHTALTENGLGVRITDGDEAKPGDFVQLWRHSGSGHSCIFRAWERKRGKIVGIRYWSTQKSTRGIGEQTERFGTGGTHLKREEFYLVRVGR